jgi:gas vesicle protein
MANRAGDFMAGVLLGGVIGAALALLLAPQSGEQTREFLKEKSGELAERAKERMADLTACVKEQAGEVVASGREALREKKERLISSLRSEKGGEDDEG